MKIGMIGAGNIDASLAGKLAAGGHEIKIANSKGPDSLGDLPRDVGARAVSKEDATVGVDVIIVSIPFATHRDLASLSARCRPVSWLSTRLTINHSGTVW